MNTSSTRNDREVVTGERKQEEAQPVDDSLRSFNAQYDKFLGRNQVHAGTAKEALDELVGIS